MQKQKMGLPQTSKIILQSGKTICNFGLQATNSFVGVLCSKNFQKYEVIVENEHFQNELRSIQWRSKTEFPIVKILFYKIIQKKLLNQCSVVQVAIQNFTYNFNTLPKMVFSQILYILKQSLIGFQRLYDRFGPFDITAKMIMINKNNKCRVWINQNITLNFPTRKNKLSQNQFIARIVRLFQEKCIRSTLSIQLFAHMGRINKLAEAIHYLESFVRFHKIVVSNRLNLNSDLTPKKNIQKYQEEQKIKKSSFGYSTFKKIPKFILNLRQQRKVDHNKDSKSFDRVQNKQKLVKDNSQIDSSQKKNYTPIKYNGNSSNSKSKISPKSQISQDVKKQTKSNNSQLNKSNVRQYTKQNSQKCLIFPHVNLPVKRLQKDASLNNLLISKVDQFSAHKQKFNRKLSNTDIDFDLQKEIEQILGSNIDIREQCSVNSSQQTATTINGSITNIPSNKQEQATIFEKNGWMKRVNNLLSQVNNSSQTIKSQHEGNQLFSDEYNLRGQQLNLLGTMGKQIKGSIINQH